MTFKLPEVTDIETEIDGRRFTGSYSVMLGNLVVYCKGRTSSVQKPDTNIREVAISLLQELVRENFVAVDSTPSGLPQQIRQAAAEYVNGFDDDELVRNLIESFGTATAGSDVHTQVSWLCLNALEPIVPFWKTMCDDDAPEQMLAELHSWMNDRSRPVDWETARQPLVGYRDGVRVVDCDACSIESIANALASCADYLQTANIDSAVKVISEAWGAHAEGCWPEDEERSYEQWLVEVALPRAYQCKPVS